MSKPTLTPAQRAALAQRLKRASNTAADSIPRRASDAIVPLSGLQSTLWLVDQLNPGTVAYNQLAGFTVTGRLDQAALATAFQIVVQRHEALHSTVTLNHEGVPTANAIPHVEAIVHDLECAIAHRDTELRRIAREPFDLANDVPIRLIVLRHDALHCSVGISAHHIGLDNLSAAIVVSELTRTYESIVTGMTSPIVAVEVRYGDFAVWQQSQLNGPRGAELRDFWVNELRDTESTLELSIDFPRPEFQPFDGARQRVEASASATQAMLDAARSFAVTPYMFCFAAFAVLLHRWSGQATFAVGTPISGRDRAELEPMVGFLNNTLIIPFDFRQPHTWQSLVATTRERLVRAFAQSELPVGQVIEVVNPPRLTDRNPMFQTNFRLAPPAAQLVDVADTQWERLALDLEYSKFDLALEVRLDSDAADRTELHGHFEYNTKLFRPQTAALLARSYVELLQTVVSHPEIDILAIPALSTSTPRPRTGPKHRQRAVTE